MIERCVNSLPSCQMLAVLCCAVLSLSRVQCSADRGRLAGVVDDGEVSE